MKKQYTPIENIFYSLATTVIVCTIIFAALMVYKLGSIIFGFPV